MSNDGYVARSMEAMVACDQDAKGRGRPCEGEIRCPLCGGRLRYRFGSSRMSFRMACETTDCLKAMS